MLELHKDIELGEECCLRHEKDIDVCNQHSNSHVLTSLGLLLKQWRNVDTTGIRLKKL